MSGRYATPYIRAGNITEEGLDLSDVLEMDFEPAEREVYALQEGDVLLAEASGSANQVGRPAIWRDQLPICCFQNTVIRFRPHAVLPEYAQAVFKHYALSGLFGQTARGIGLLHLGASRFSNMPFPLPPLAEQQRIADALEARLGELGQARAALEDALAGTYLQDEAILAATASGALAAEAPRGASEGTDPSLSDVRARLEIPAEWSWSTVGQAGELTLGKGLGPGSRRGELVVPYLRVANVLEDYIDLTDLKEMSFTADELDRYRLRAGDVLLNDGQSPELVGRPAMYGGELEDLCFQNHLIRFRAHPEVDAQFALLIFRHYLRAGEFRRIARGSTNIANLSRSRLAAMPFPVPPLDQQHSLAEEARRRLDASLDQRVAIESSLTYATAMEQELLAAAVSGQLVEQRDSDESAAELLSRLGAPQSEPKAARVRSMAPRRAQPIPRPDTAEPLDIRTILVQAGKPLTFTEVCLAAGVDVNDVGDIERFYTALRDQLGASIQVVGEDPESARLVEVPPRAT